MKRELKYCIYTSMQYANQPAQQHRMVSVFISVDFSFFTFCANREDSDQAAQMCSLSGASPVGTCHKETFQAKLIM